jgi:hypothetical protein
MKVVLARFELALDGFLDHCLLPVGLQHQWRIVENTDVNSVHPYAAVSSYLTSVDIS